MSSRNFDQNRFLHLTSFMDYMKNNNFRIAHHSMSRTKAPLADRNDIKPLLPFAEGVGAKCDIIALDGNKKITFVKFLVYDELTAHFQGDEALWESLEAVNEADVDEFRFIYVTTGIITPTLIQDDYKAFSSKISQIDFMEVKYDVSALHKINDPDIYLRKVVGQTKKMTGNFSEYSGEKCDCGESYFKGTYNIEYWNKTKSFTYYICGECGTQWEDKDNPAQISNFLTGLSTR